MSIGRIGQTAGPVRARVPAKINLVLSVGDLRPDGFHELDTVFQAVDLFDEVTVRPADDWSVHIPGYPRLPTDKTNLAVAAAQALHTHIQAFEVGDLAPEPVHIEIDKKIPVAGGMAGGSADAAAVLIACNALWHADLGRDELAELAADLGSDVPFAVFGGTAVGTGRGELLSPVLTRMTLHWVVALADGGLSTPEVFAELDRLRAAGHREPSPDVQELVAALRAGSVSGVAECLGNDLQAAALSLSPSLRSTQGAGLDAGALAAIVSGSGPTIAMLCRDAEHSAAVAAEMSASGTCRTVKMVTGPVPGARLLQAMI